MILCVDFGSTFTKAVGVTLERGEARLDWTASVPTSSTTDVLDGYRDLRHELRRARWPNPTEVLACSSAGGGLRLAVVGYERTVTAEAGHRVGLSAGARVVHIATGPMGSADVAALRASRPDIVLLVGGTDGGNADVLLHNAGRLAAARVAAPVVVAGNSEAADEVAACLGRTGRRFEVTTNVLPRIGVIAPDGARAAIRAAFLRHVIGGKGLSRGKEFASLVRAATPDAMLSGVESLAAAVDGDVLVVDVGGATTDVYSAIDPEGEDAGLSKDVVAPMWQSRTVEGDLGVRWNAEGIVRAALAEGLCDEALRRQLEPYAARVAALPAFLPEGTLEQSMDLELTRLAAVVAVRRHARPAGPGGSPRPLQNVAFVIGSGGVLRHAGADVADGVLAAVSGDVAGGWKVPRAAQRSVDTAYVLFAAGLLAAVDRSAARDVARLVIPARR